MLTGAIRFGIAAASLAAGVSVVNRSLRAPATALTNHLGGREVRWRWRDFDVSATEAGNGQTVLLVHGIYAGSSSYEFRRIFGLLARHRHVVAIDFLGCGHSERPNIAYTAELFVEQIVAAVERFGNGSTIVVASSLGGAFAIRAAARLQHRIAGLVVVSPTGLGRALDGERTQAGRAITSVFRSPILGEALFNLLASRPSLTWFLQNQGYADPRSVTPKIVDDYWIATHQAGARYVPAHFVGGALNCSVAADLPNVRVPMLIAWGERAIGTSPIASAMQYVGLARNARLATFPHSRLLPQEEEPTAFVACVEEFFGEIG